MDYLSKIQQVRENIQDWQKEHGNEFSYVVSGFYSENYVAGESSTIISLEEQKEIVQYLARRKFLEIIKETPTSYKIKILSKSNPVIKLKTLELIARELKDHYTGYEITKMLEECGVDKKFIIPNSKWLIFYRIFEELSISKDEKAKELLYKIICESIHPLNLSGNTEMSEILINKFNSYLDYDELMIFYSENDKTYEILRNRKHDKLTEYEEEAFFQDLFNQEQEELSFLREQENKDKISTLRKAYQVFMNIVEVYCENPSKPNHELNDAYVSTKQLMMNIVNTLHLHNGILIKEDKDRPAYSKIITLKYFFIPYDNLFTAEAEYKKRQKEELNWDNIRPRMHATYGSIDEVYRKVDGSDILSKPDIQETLNDISLLLSKTKEENKKIADKKQKAARPQIPVQKIKITSMPDLRVRKVEENVVVKNNKKRITLPKFPRTEWSKVSIRFIDEREILLSNEKDVKPTSFEGLGCDDGRNGKPDENWNFLIKLAIGNGQTEPILKTEREKRKKQKQKITDILRKIFQNDTDPFETESGGVYKAKFNINYPINNKKLEVDRCGDLKEVHSEMTGLLDEI